MGPKDFPEAAFGAITPDRAAHCGGGSHYANTGAWERRRAIPLRRGFPEMVPKGEGTAVHAAALFAGITKIALPPNMLLRAETHGGNDASGRRSDIKRP